MLIDGAIDGGGEELIANNASMDNVDPGGSASEARQGPCGQHHHRQSF